MIRPLVTLARAALRQPLRALAVVALLALIALGAGVAGLRWWLGAQERAVRTAMERRDYDGARERLTSALRFDPHSRDLNFLMGRLARLAGQNAEAERALDVARRYGAPAEAVALERTLLQVQQGQLPLPTEVSLRNYVNARHADSVYILEALTEAYMRSYRLKDALDCLDLWLEERPDDVAGLMSRGWVRERQDNLEGARDDYRRAAEAAPERAEPEVRLGQILLFLESNQEARDVLERAWRRHPGDPAAGLALAQSHARFGQFDEARRLLDGLLADAPREAPFLLERGRLALQEGEPAAAEPWLRKAAELLPNDYQTNYVLSQCLRRRGKEAEAKALDAKVERIQADMKRMRGLTDQLQGRPHDANLRCEIANIFFRGGERREGLLWLQAALQIDPRSRVAHEALARYYEENGDAAQAAQHRAAALGN